MSSRCQARPRGRWGRRRARRERPAGPRELAARERPMGPGDPAARSGRRCQAYPSIEIRHYLPHLLSLGPHDDAGEQGKPSLPPPRQIPTTASLLPFLSLISDESPPRSSKVGRAAAVLPLPLFVVFITVVAARVGEGGGTSWCRRAPPQWRYSSSPPRFASSKGRKGGWRRRRRGNAMAVEMQLLLEALH
jgi:hypothetical protein